MEKADVAKWCLYCKSVLKKVTIKIRGRYQKLIATKGAANAIVCSSKPTAIAVVTKDGKRFTRRVMMSITDKKRTNIWAEKIDLCKERANAGIKDCVKAPSAKIRRKRFGSLKAIKNISLYMLAPSAEAVNISLINPKILDTKIPKLLVKIALNIGLLYYFYESLTNIRLKCTL